MRPKILYKLFSSLETIKGIGPKNAKLIERLCGKYLLDLILHRPIAYIDRRNSPKIKDLSNNSIVTLILKVDGHTPSFNKRMPYKITCSDYTGQLNIVYFNLRGPYLKKMFPIGSKKVVSGKVEEFNGIFQGSFPGINNLNACGNTVQENRPRLAVPKHERLQTPIDTQMMERLRQ